MACGFAGKFAASPVPKACVPKETRKAIQLFKRGAGVSDEVCRVGVS